MFNYDLPLVQESLRVVSQQAQRAQEIDAQIRAAIQVITQGNWLGESEVGFTEDAARLEASIQALHQNLANYLAHLSQASSFVQEAMSAIGGVIANLP
jgi:uncharacterized protein YukE